MSVYQDIHWDKIFLALASDAPTVMDVKQIWPSVWPFVDVPPARTIGLAIARYEEGYYAAEEPEVPLTPKAPAVREEPARKLFEEDSKSSEEVLARSALGNIWPKKYIAECMAEILHEIASTDQFQKAGPHGVALSKILRDHINDSTSLILDQVDLKIKAHEARVNAMILASETRVVEAMLVAMGAPSAVADTVKASATHAPSLPAPPVQAPTVKAKKVIIYGAMQEQVVTIERHLAERGDLPPFKIQLISNQGSSLPAVPSGDVALIWQKFANTSVSRNIAKKVGHANVKTATGIKDSVEALTTLLASSGKAGSTKAA